MIIVKFTTFEQIEKFHEITSRLNSDVLLHKGRICVDAKSLIAIYSMNLAKELELEIIEKDENEVNNYIDELFRIGVVVKQ